MARSYQELMDLAAECRELATAARSKEIREQLVNIAEQFERLAADIAHRAERGRKIPC
jgi:hypothetical protein